MDEKEHRNHVRRPCPNEGRIRCFNVHCHFEHKLPHSTTHTTASAPHSRSKASTLTSGTTRRTVYHRVPSTSTTSVSPGELVQHPLDPIPGAPRPPFSEPDAVPLIPGKCPHGTACKNINCPFKHSRPCPHGQRCVNVFCPFQHPARVTTHEVPCLGASKVPGPEGQARHTEEVRALVYTAMRAGRDTSFNVLCPYIRGTCANINCPFQHPVHSARGRTKAGLTGQLSVLSPILRRFQRGHTQKRTLQLHRLAHGSYTRTDKISKGHPRMRLDAKRKHPARGLYSRAVSQWSRRVLPKGVKHDKPENNSLVTIAGQTWKRSLDGETLTLRNKADGGGGGDDDDDDDKDYVPAEVVLHGIPYHKRVDGDGVVLVRAPALSKASVARRILARRNKRAKSRNITLRVDQRGSQHCLFYTRFGRCNAGSECPYIHDANRIAVCRLYLQGSCTNSDCPFRHTDEAGRVPVCAHFLRGQCANESCRYAHERVNPQAEVCPSFHSTGTCTDRASCLLQHPTVCPFHMCSQACPLKSKCCLAHTGSKSVRKVLSLEPISIQASIVRQGLNLSTDMDPSDPATGQSNQNQASILKRDENTSSDPIAGRKRPRPSFIPTSQARQAKRTPTGSTDP